MESENLKITDILKQEYNHQYLEAKKCPKCSSVFITDTGCDSCHYQFDFNYIGEALGEKSFYSIREKYWASLGFLSRTYKSLECKNPLMDHFKNACLHRLELLLRFLSGPNIENHNDYNLYFKEFKDVVFELILLGFKDHEIWKLIDRGDVCTGKGQNNVYQQISLCIEEAGRINENNQRPIFQRFFNYKVAGVLRSGVLFLFLVTSVIVCLLSISIFRYLQLVT